MAVADIGINVRSGATVGLYSLGFFESAVTLFERADRGRGLVDLAFYPAAFCLRQGLELLLKQMSIYFANAYRKPGLLYKKGHKLKDTWKAVRDLVEDEATGPFADPGEDTLGHFDVIDSLIDEFDEIDPTGMLFRYPEDLFNDKGTRVVVQTPVPFDLVNLSDWAAKASAALEAAQQLESVVQEMAGFTAHR